MGSSKIRLGLGSRKLKHTLGKQETTTGYLGFEVPVITKIQESISHVKNNFVSHNECYYG